jgi:hypothetical protein
VSYLAAENWLWALLIYDNTGKLVDVPQSDVVSIDVEDVINGGSGQGSVVFRRPFNAIGALGFRYLFQLFIWQRGTARPADPCWSGHFVDFEQKELLTTGEITATLDGDFKLLDDALVNISINPNVGGNPGLDAGPFTSSMLTTFEASAYFGTPSVPATMFPLEPTQFQDDKLGDALDTITKIGRDDTSGLLFVWFVRTKGDLTRKVVVQLDQNPNVVAGVKFVHLFKDAQLTNYLVQTKYSNVFNVLAVYGGQDDNGQQVYGVYKDPTSIAVLGATIEARLSNDSIRSQAAAQTYAQNQLDLNSSPIAQGSFDLLEPNPTLLAGTWVQLWETPQTATEEASIKQVRLAVVKWSIKSERIVQTCSLESPAPYLDDAIYRLGLETDVRAAIQNSEAPANRQQLYVRAGGFVTATASGPAKIATAAIEAVFPPVGLISVAPFALAAIVDNSGSATNGETGDGAYVLSLTSAGAYVITKGTPPANTSTQQNLVAIWVQGGVPYTSDARTLIAGMPSDPALAAPSLATAATFVNPVNSGQSLFTQRVQFSLLSPLSNASYLAHFVLEAVPCSSSGVVLTDSTGTPLPPQRSVDFSPTGGNNYDVSINLGAGAYYQLQIRSLDQHARASAACVLGNTSNHPLAGSALPGVPSGAAIAATGTFVVTSYTSAPSLVTIAAALALTPSGFTDASWIAAINVDVAIYLTSSTLSAFMRVAQLTAPGATLPSTIDAITSAIPKNAIAGGFKYEFMVTLVPYGPGASGLAGISSAVNCTQGASGVSTATSP